MDGVPERAELRRLVQGPILPGEGRAPLASVLRAVAPVMREHPVFMGRYLAVLERTLAPRRDLVLTGSVGSASLGAMRMAVAQRYDPFLVVGFDLRGEDDAAVTRFPMLGPASHGEAAAWLCEGTVCLPPITDVATLLRALDGPIHE